MADPGMGCWLATLFSLPLHTSCSRGAPYPQGWSLAPTPALLSLLSQGLCLCRHNLLLRADHLPLSLHCAEEASPGDMGRCRGPPCLWGAGQTSSRQDPSTGTGCAFCRWTETGWSPIGGALSPACLYFPSGPPSPLLHPSGLHPQMPQIPPSNVTWWRALLGQPRGALWLAP